MFKNVYFNEDNDADIIQHLKVIGNFSKWVRYKLREDILIRSGATAEYIDMYRKVHNPAQDNKIIKEETHEIISNLVNGIVVQDAEEVVEEKPEVDKELIIEPTIEPVVEQKPKGKRFDANIM